MGRSKDIIYTSSWLQPNLGTYDQQYKEKEVGPKHNYGG